MLCVGCNKGQGEGQNYMGKVGAGARLVREVLILLMCPNLQVRVYVEIVVWNASGILRLWLACYWSVPLRGRGLRAASRGSMVPGRREREERALDNRLEGVVVEKRALGGPRHEDHL